VSERKASEMEGQSLAAGAGRVTAAQQVEKLYKRHPELSWDSYEQNAADMGLELDSEEFWTEVLLQAGYELDI
jgi:hypothetical protein